MDVLTVSGLTFNVKTTHPEDVDLVENTGETIFILTFSAFFVLLLLNSFGNEAFLLCSEILFFNLIEK